MSAAVAPAALAPRDHATVLLVSVGHGVTHWLHMVVFIVLPVVREEFGLDYTDIGLFGVVYYSASTLVNATSGPLTDLAGRREWFQVASLVLLGVAVVALGLADTFWLYCAAGALVAIGNALWHPAAIPYLATRYDGHRGYVLSMHSIFANLGDSVAPAVVGAMITGWFLVALSWREAAMLNALPALLVLPLIVWFVAHDPHAARATRGARLEGGAYFRALWSRLKTRAVVGIALMAGLRATAQGGIRVFLPLYVTDALGMSLAVAGIALTALSVGGVLAAMPAGIASDRFGRRPVTMIALGVSTVLIVAVTALRSELALVVGVCLVGFSIFALRPVLLSWMMDVMPGDLRGAGTNIMFTSQSLFQMVSPLVAGAIADAYGLASVFYYFAGMLLLANAVAFLLPKERAGA